MSDLTVNGQFYSAEYQGSQVVGTKEQIEEFEKTGNIPNGAHQLPPDPSIFNDKDSKKSADELQKLRPDITDESYAEWEKEYNEALAENDYGRFYSAEYQGSQVVGTQEQIEEFKKTGVLPAGVHQLPPDPSTFNDKDSKKSTEELRKLRPDVKNEFYADWEKEYNEALAENDYGRFYSAEYQGSQVVGTQEQIEEFKKTGVLPAGVHQLPPDPSTLQ